MIIATQATQTALLTVSGIGAGPNLTRARVLPVEAFEPIDCDEELVQFSSTSNRPRDFLGVVSLTVILESTPAGSLI